MTPIALAQRILAFSNNQLRRAYAYKLHIDPSKLTPEATEAEAGLHTILARAFKRMAKQAAGLIPITLGKLAKASDADDLAEEIFASLKDEFDALPAKIQKQLRAAAKAGARRGLSQLRVNQTDNINAANQLAYDYADERAAEMVGMRWDDDGNLIENSNAEWRITDKVRDDLRTMIRDAFAEETPIDELQDNIQSAGAFSESRAAMIAATEVKNAQSAGNYRAWDSTGLVKSLQWLLSEDHDYQTECECESNEDVIVPMGQPFPSGSFFPPEHPNCVLGQTIVTPIGSISAYTKRWFTGEIVRIRVEGNHTLACSPNHPVLSGRGLIVAGQLSQFDNVFFSVEPWSASRWIYPNDNYMPAVMEKIFCAALVSCGMTTVSMKSTAEDFHGDGIPNGNIYIVAPTRFLKSQRQVSQNIGHRLFQNGSSSMRPSFNSQRFAHRFRISNFAATYRSMGSRSHGLPIFSSHLAECQVSSSRLRTNWQTMTLEDAAQYRTVNVELLSQCHAGFASLIAPVKVLDIQRESFHGWIYNLQTNSGFYFADGILTHNCWCVVVASELEGD